MLLIKTLIPWFSLIHNYVNVSRNNFSTCFLLTPAHQKKKEAGKCPVREHAVCTYVHRIKDIIVILLLILFFTQKQNSVFNLKYYCHILTREKA